MRAPNRLTTWEDVNEALETVDQAEAVLLVVKRRVAEQIRDAYRERDLRTDTIVDKGLLGKMLKGETFSRPAVDRVMDDLRRRDQSEA